MTRSGASAAVRRARRWLAAITAVTLVSSLASPAAANGRIAVVLVSEDGADAELAENLAEVAIAAIAERRAGELLGARELGGLLRQTRAGTTVAACVADTTCLAHLREELAIASLVSGKLGRSDARRSLEFELLDAETGEQRRRVVRHSGDGVVELVEATQSGVAELFAPITEAVADRDRPSLSPTAILAVPAPVPGAATASTRQVLATPPPEPVMAWRTTAGYAFGALALLSLSTAAVFGALASQEPDGVTRRDAQADLKQGQTFATTANVLWISGGVLAAVSLVALIPPGRSATSQ